MGTDAVGVLRQAAEWLEEGHAVALATVLSTWGSAPRVPGSHMAICDSGAFVGSVSGGCVEAAVIEASRAVLDTGNAAVLEYGISDDDAWAVGLACGGRVKIRLERIGRGSVNPTILQKLRAALRDGEAVVLAMHMASGRQAVLRPLVSAPKDGAGAGDPTADGDPIAWPLSDAALALMEDRSFTVGAPGGEVFLRPYNPPVRVVVVGAVHVSQPLARLTSTVGYEVTVVDPRRAFATEERFPGVHLLRKWPEEALAELAPGHRTAVVTLTHDPKLDDPALAAALATPAFYVGALGSRRTHAARLKRLRERGLDEDALSRIHAPVGLDIGARGPEEIAVAVLGQIVERLRAPRT